MSLICVRYRCGHTTEVGNTRPAKRCPQCGAPKVAILAPRPTVTFAKAVGDA